ncbi:hypothetical protein [Rhodovulum strictum]|uniref:hypothetical protein n=1 Tax=Rhodovulum strictum TaxID=58314 RepID=UPI001FE44CE6|nr:hypothetical protein [Rhodovulum strictum]
MPDPLALRPARVHEAEGPGRRAFAVFQAARHPGPLVWILPAHAPQMPMPPGLPPGIASRLHLVRPKGETDLLWAIEESLRAAPVGLVIAEPEKPLSLTAGRRFQLAAEAGQTTGLILIRDGAGSNAAETRWHCAPRAADAADSTLQCWSRIKNKRGTTGRWIVNWDGASAAFDLVSATGERHEPAPPPRPGALRADPAQGQCRPSALPDA